MFGFVVPSLIRTIAPYAVVMVAGIAVGWQVNGWRLEARISGLKASYAEAYAKAEADARKREQELRVSADKLRKDKDARIQSINSFLAIALNSLRNRPSRNDLSADSSSCAGATGAELSRESASDIIREAARADQTVEMLNYCIAQYNSLR
jgi:hypothetical protein